MESEPELLTCSCCGAFFRGTYDGSSDTGFGTCPECEVWSLNMIVDARIPIVRRNLSPESRAKFDAMSRPHQTAVIIGLMERGVIC